MFAEEERGTFYLSCATRGKDRRAEFCLGNGGERLKEEENGVKEEQSTEWLEMCVKKDKEIELAGSWE